MNEQHIGSSVRAMREHRGWTQEKLAGEADLSVQAISNIERRVSEPTITTLRVIARVMGYAVTDFFDEDAKKVEDDPVRATELRTSLEKEMQSLSAFELESVMHHIQGIRRFHR